MTNDVVWTQTISSRKDYSAKDDAPKRGDNISEQEMADYKLAYGGKLRMEQRSPTEHVIIKGAEIIETYDDEETCKDRYDYLVENKIACGILLGDAQIRFNIGGRTNAGSYSGWVRT